MQAEEPKVVDDDDSEHKRKTILKQMMASKRLAEFRRLNHDKDDLKKKIEERHAISTAEVDRRADQAIRIKREIEEQFLKTQKERDDLKQGCIWPYSPAAVADHCSPRCRCGHRAVGARP